MGWFYDINKLKNELLGLKNIEKVGLHEQIEPWEQKIEFTKIRPDSHDPHIRYDVTRQWRWPQKIPKKNHSEYFGYGHWFPDPQGQMKKKRYYGPP